jgi:hypothetical protein
VLRLANGLCKFRSLNRSLSPSSVRLLGLFIQGSLRLWPQTVAKWYVGGTGWRYVVNFIYWTLEPPCGGGGGPPGNHCTRGWMGPRADLDILENKKLSFPWALGLSKLSSRDLQCAFCCTSPFRRLCLWQQKVAGSGQSTSELAPFIFTAVTQSISGACCQNI